MPYSTSAAMSWLVLLALLAGCSSVEREQQEKSAAMAPVPTGDAWMFKLWPAAKERYLVRLAGVTHTSAYLGPDFTVHDFDLGDAGSVGIYHGMHLQEETEQPISRLSSSFDGVSARWNLYKTAATAETKASASTTSLVRAVACVPDPHSEDPYLWHVIVEAGTEAAAREIVAQLRTFKRLPAD